MKRWGKTPAGYSQWRIGTEDGSEVEFPPDARLRTLFRNHVIAIHDHFVVVNRQPNDILIQAPKGLTQHDCEAFVRALWKETHFK